MIEPTLIEKVRGREDGAFKAMYEASIRYVYAIVKRYINNDSEHADVIQEIYARVFLSINTYDSKKGEFQYWLRRITVNQCAMHYRQGKSPRQVISMDGIQQIDNSMESKLTQLTSREIEMFVENMPDGYKQVFMMIVIDEFTHKEVSEMLEITVETSRSQLSRAKTWLRKHLTSLTTNKYLTIASGG